MRSLLDGLYDFESDTDRLHSERDGELWAEIHEFGGGFVAADQIVDSDGRAHFHVSLVSAHRRQSSSVESAESLQVSIVDFGRAADFDEENLLGEFERFDGKNQRIQTFVDNSHAKVLQNLIGVFVCVSVVNVNDVVDAGTDGSQSSRQQQNKSHRIHFRFQAANFSNYQQEIKRSL